MWHITLEHWAQYVAGSAIVFAIFAWGESILRDSAKAALGRALVTTSAKTFFLGLRRGYIQFFDGLFGVRRVVGPITVPSLWRSSVFSVAATFTFFFVQKGSLSLLALPAMYARTGLPFDRPNLFQSANVLAILMLLPTINFVFDYVSLAQTRLSGALLAKLPSPYALVVVPANALLTTLIAIVAAITCFTLLNVLQGCTLPERSGTDLYYCGGLLSGLAEGLGRLPAAANYLLFGDVRNFSATIGLAAPMAIADYAHGGVDVIDYDARLLRAVVATTSVTSVWLWLYLSTGLVVWLASKFDAFRRRLFLVVAVETHPGKVLGFFAFLIWTIGYWLFRLLLK